MVLPAGARVVSHGAYWTNRTYGRSGMAAGGDVGLGRGDLVERPAEVDRRRAARTVRGPRDRPVERPVDLEDARSVAEPLRPAPCPPGQPVAGDRDELARRRRRTGRHAPRGRSASVVDPMAGDDLAAGRLQLGDERRRHGRRAAADHRPADRVGIGREDEPERGAQRAIEVEHRVGGDPGEERPGRLVPEPAAGQPARRAERRQPEPGERQRVARDVDDGPEELRCELAGVADERPEQPSPRPSVRRHRARAAVALTDRSSTAARPPSSGCATGASGWIELDAAGREVDRRGRTARPAPAAGSSSTRRGGTRGASAPSVRVPPPAVRGGLVDPDRAPGTGQGDRRGEAVRPGPDDDGVDRAARPAVARSATHERRDRRAGGGRSARRFDLVVRVVHVGDLDRDVAAGRPGRLERDEVSPVDRDPDVDHGARGDAREAALDRRRIRRGSGGR